MAKHTCFECGSEEDIHHHHVVPKSLGGTKTLPLCSKCHSLVHSTDLTSTSRLTKEALDKRRIEGKAVSGLAPYGLMKDVNNDLVPNLQEIAILRLIQKFRNTPYGKAKNRKTPWHVVASQLNDRGIKNRNSSDWTMANVRKVIITGKRYAHLLKKYL